MKKEKEKLTAVFNEFASRNNFLYKEKVEESFLTSHVFSLGDNRSTSDCFMFMNESLPFQFFNFKYEDRRGRRTSFYFFQVLVFELGESVPHIYVHNKNNITLPEPFSENQAIRLKVDIDYEKDRTCYVLKGQEIEALQILDYSFIEVLSKVVPFSDLEFKDKNMFIYIPKELTLNEFITKAFNRSLYLKNNFEEMALCYEKINEPLKKVMSRFSFTSDISNKNTVLNKGFW